MEVSSLNEKLAVCIEESKRKTGQKHTKGTNNDSKESDGADSEEIAKTKLNEKPQSKDDIQKDVNIGTDIERSLLTLKKPERKVIIMRHGERLDFTFEAWIEETFDIDGNYNRTDLNMPKTLPARRNSPLSWKNDAPLTTIGCYQSRLIGEFLAEADEKFDHIYSSPAFRCIQSTINVLEGLQSQDIKIRLEPGLFESLAWYRDGKPAWLTKEELLAANYKIDEHYKPIMSEQQLNVFVLETTSEFYQRNFEVFHRILKTTNGNILVVGHACTLETCTCQLTGHPPRSIDELREILKKVYFCSMIGMEKRDETWYRVKAPCLTITHMRNPRFNYHTLFPASSRR